VEFAMSAKSYDVIIDQIANMKVSELNDLVEAIQVKFNVSAVMAAAPAASGSADATEAVAAEKSDFKVTLKDVGSEKIKVIKALREVIPNLALSDAKKLTEEAPVVIAESAAKADADKMKAKLEEVGAKVELA
jgi:large subunit ribosomal protein L7/L12